MTASKPPTAVVADIVVEPDEARGPLIALAVACLFQFGWVCVLGPSLFDMVETGYLTPIGLLCAVGGSACLYLAIGRLGWRGTLGRLPFAFAAVLQALCVYAWWGGRDQYYFGPFALGLVLACIGVRIVNRHKGAGLGKESP